MDDSLILKEEIDPNYEPTQEEIIEYAEYLGLSLPEDEDLLYLVKEGLKAPLPQEWKPCKTKDDEIYYFNFETGESDWVHPCDKIYRQKLKDMKAAKLKKQPKPALPQKAKKPPLPTELPERDANELNKRKAQLRAELEREQQEIRAKSSEAFTKYKKNIERLDSAEQILRDSQSEAEKERAMFQVEKKEVLARLREQLQRDKVNRLEKPAGLQTDPLSKERLLKKLTEKLRSERQVTIGRSELILSSQLEELNVEFEGTRDKNAWALQEIESIKQKSAKKRRTEVAEAKTRFETEIRQLKAIHDTTVTTQETPVLGQQEMSELRLFQKQLDAQLAEALKQHRLERASQSDRRKEWDRTAQRKMEKELEMYRKAKEREGSESSQAKKELEYQLVQVNKEISELAQQVTQKAKAMPIAQPDDRIDKLTREVQSLKQMLAPVSKIDLTIDEREELRISQRQLQADRERWRAELKSFKEHPTDEKRTELSALKKLIERGIFQHNEKVKRFRENEDRTLAVEEIDDRPRKPVCPRQPWEVHNQHIFHRQVSKWAKQRGHAQDVMARHGTWLNSMRHELTRMSPVEAKYRGHPY